MGRKSRDWSKVKEEYIKSGMTRREYAESIGMTLSWLNRGLNTLNKEEAQKDGPGPGAGKEFIPVEVKEGPALTPGYTINIKAGNLIIEVPADAGEEALGRVLKAAEKTCRA